MNKKEREYYKCLMLQFKYKCHGCGCTPHNDEWSDKAKNLCIDCEEPLEDIYWSKTRALTHCCLALQWVRGQV